MTSAMTSIDDTLRTTNYRQSQSLTVTSDHIIGILSAFRSSHRNIQLIL